MKTSEKHVKEPLFHITKRADISILKSILIYAVAVVAALVICALVIISVTKYNPIEVYKEMIKGNFETKRKFFNLLQDTAMLLCISLAVTPAFKMKFWNLGAEGQVLVGGLASAACMFYFKSDIPSWALILLMLVTSILCGIIWGVLPAVFKAIWNTNESLFTLMMNYVAIQLISYFIAVWVPTGSQVLGVLNQKTKFGWLPDLFGQKYLLNIIIVLTLTVIVFIYMRFSKQGYEISVVGESENTARYVGINVKKVIIRTMIISGAICGIAGFLLVSGASHSIHKGLAGGMGFTAIMVAWLSKFNPGVMVFVSMFLMFLQHGASSIATKFNLDKSVSDILIGIIIFCIIGSDFFINYKINKRAKAKEVTQ